MRVLRDIAVTRVARTIARPTHYTSLNEAIAVSFETGLYYAMSLAAFYSHEMLYK